MISTPEYSQSRALVLSSIGLGAPIRAAEVLRARTPAARLAAVLKESMVVRKVRRRGEEEIDEIKRFQALVSEFVVRLDWTAGTD